MVLLSLFKGALFYQSKLERTEHLFQKQFPSPVIFWIPLAVFFDSFTWIRAYLVPNQSLLLFEPVVKSKTFLHGPQSATMEMITTTQVQYISVQNEFMYKYKIKSNLYKIYLEVHFVSFLEPFKKKNWAGSQIKLFTCVGKC